MMRTNRAGWVIASLITMLAASTTQAAGTPEQKCQQAKHKARGKLHACWEKNAAGIIGGKADVSGECQTKFEAALQKADDKATAAGTKCRFVDNGGGTVSDLNTGLMWEKKQNLDGSSEVIDHRDADNTYDWSTASSPYVASGHVFSDLLWYLNGGVSGVYVAGHCDWRLPTIQELQDIVDSTQSPKIDPAFGPTQPAYYWSVTFYDPSTAGAVDFLTGTASGSSKNTNHYARAVRGGL